MCHNRHSELLNTQIIPSKWRNGKSKRENGTSSILDGWQIIKMVEKSINNGFHPSG
jgi:hypothetical protein